MYYSEVAATSTLIQRIDRSQAPGAFVIATLPLGTYQLAYCPQGLWAWGRNVDKYWEIWLIPEGRAAEKIASMPDRIVAVAPAGPHAAIVAISTDILLARKGAAPVRLARTRKVVDGLAVDADGSLLLSLNNSVVRMVGKEAILPIAEGLHGPLLVRGGAIYVLSRERHQVLQLVK